MSNYRDECVVCMDVNAKFKVKYLLEHCRLCCHLLERGKIFSSLEYFTRDKEDKYIPLHTIFYTIDCFNEKTVIFHASFCSRKKNMTIIF